VTVFLIIWCSCCCGCDVIWVWWRFVVRGGDGGGGGGGGGGRTHTHTHTHTNTLQRRTLIHTQDVLEKVGSIPEDILSRITAKILVGLTYLHRQKHMVRGGLGFCTLSSSAS